MKSITGKKYSITNSGGYEITVTISTNDAKALDHMESALGRIKEEAAAGLRPDVLRVRHVVDITGPVDSELITMARRFDMVHTSTKYKARMHISNDVAPSMLKHMIEAINNPSDDTWETREIEPSSKFLQCPYLEVRK